MAVSKASYRRWAACPRNQWCVTSIWCTIGPRVPEPTHFKNMTIRWLFKGLKCCHKLTPPCTPWSISVIHRLGTEILRTVGVIISVLWVRVDSWPDLAPIKQGAIKMPFPRSYLLFLHVMHSQDSYLYSHLSTSAFWHRNTREPNLRTVQKSSQHIQPHWEEAQATPYYALQFEITWKASSRKTIVRTPLKPHRK